jgi:hypothetical protein
MLHSMKVHTRAAAFSAFRSHLQAQTALYSRAAICTIGAQGDIIDGAVPLNADYVANKAHMDSLLERHNALIGHILLGGGEKAQSRLKSRNKLFVRRR